MYCFNRLHMFSFKFPCFNHATLNTPMGSTCNRVYFMMIITFMHYSYFIIIIIIILTYTSSISYMYIFRNRCSIVSISRTPCLLFAYISNHYLFILVRGFWYFNYFLMPFHLYGHFHACGHNQVGYIIAKSNFPHFN